jgi:hypothetical protein
MNGLDEYHTPLRFEQCSFSSTWSINYLEMIIPVWEESLQLISELEQVCYRIRGEYQLLLPS